MAISRAWYYQRKFLRKVYNRYVNQYFSDVPDVDDQLDASTTRREVKSACLIRPKDSQNMAILKIMTFYNVVQKVQFEPQYYGIGIQPFLDQLRHKAQIILHFKEKKTTAFDNNRIPAKSQVSFRLFEDTWTTSKVQSWANTIKNEFATPVFSYTKGTLNFSYKDHGKGFNFQLYTQSETDAKNVISKCFAARNEGTPDWENYLKLHQDNKNWSQVQYKTVLGESRRLPRKRPIAEVYFQYAELLIPDLGETITLVDRSGQRPEPILVA
jgi:hypothetical protein